MVSVKKINKLNVVIVPEGTDCAELTAENAALFYTASQYSKPLYEMVVSEFEETLKKEAGLEKKLKKTKKVELEKGDIKFNVTVTPSTSTSYQKVCQRFASYLEDLQEAAASGIRRAGVRTLEDEHYIGIAEAEAKFEQFTEENTSPRATPKITYSKMRDVSLEKMLTAVEVEPENCGKFTGENAKLYRVAKEQGKMIGKQVIEPFSKALKAETGFSKDNLPAETVYGLYEIGNYVFQVVSAPRENTKYGEVAQGIKDVFNQAVVETGVGRATIEGLKIRDGQGFLSINYLVGKYEKMLKDNTSTILEQTISVMPKPKYDSVVSA